MNLRWNEQGWLAETLDTYILDVLGSNLGLQTTCKGKFRDLIVLKRPLTFLPQETPWFRRQSLVCYIKVNHRKLSLTLRQKSLSKDASYMLHTGNLFTTIHHMKFLCQQNDQTKTVLKEQENATTLGWRLIAWNAKWHSFCKNFPPTRSWNFDYKTSWETCSRRSRWSRLGSVTFRRESLISHRAFLQGKRLMRWLCTLCVPLSAAEPTELFIINFVQQLCR